MKWPWVSREKYALMAGQVRHLRMLSKYWYEELERSEDAYRRLELKLISLRGELQYERERRIAEKVKGIV